MPPGRRPSDPPVTIDDDQVAQQYKKAKESLWRERFESYSMMKLIGDLTGKKIVDAACGEGHFTRNLRQAGGAMSRFLRSNCPRGPRGRGRSSLLE